MNIGRAEALTSLRPNAEWAINGDTLTWLDGVHTEPTQEEIQVEIIRLQADWDAQEYARLRKGVYPDIGDQLDDLFHAGAFSTEMSEKLQAVKDMHPKG
jgi:hypothetical protein